jgi:hypothetical protein
MDPASSPSPSVSPSSQPSNPNVALGKPTSQSSNGYVDKGYSFVAVDGNTNGKWEAGSVAHTVQESGPWWKVDLEGTYEIEEIIIYNRQDCCAARLQGVLVEVFLDGSVVWSTSPAVIVNPVVVNNVPPNVQGDTVKLSLQKTEILNFAELQVFAFSV